MHKQDKGLEEVQVHTWVRIPEGAPNKKTPSQLRWCFSCLMYIYDSEPRPFAEQNGQCLRFFGRRFEIYIGANVGSESLKSYFTLNPTHSPLPPRIPEGDNKNSIK